LIIFSPTWCQVGFCFVLTFLLIVLGSRETENCTSQLYQGGKMQKCFISLLVVMFAMIQPAAAQRKAPVTDAKMFEVSFAWGRSQTFAFQTFPGSARTANGALLTDTTLILRRQPSFTAMASYQPFKVMHVGVQLTSTPDARAIESQYPGHAAADDSWYSITATEVQWGIVGFITTPWSNPSSRASWLMYRAKIGGTFDLSGYSIDALVSQSNGSVVEQQLGRMHEHRFFVSLETGFKNPFGRAGAVFGHIGYAYSLYQFAHEDAPGLRFAPNTRHRLTLGVGISIS